MTSNGKKFDRIPFMANGRKKTNQTSSTYMCNSCSSLDVKKVDGKLTCNQCGESEEG